MAEGTPLVIMEGQTREVCVNLFEPEELNAFIDLTIIETPQSVSGESLVLYTVQYNSVQLVLLVFWLFLLFVRASSHCHFVVW